MTLDSCTTWYVERGRLNGLSLVQSPGGVCTVHYRHPEPVKVSDGVFPGMGADFGADEAMRDGEDRARLVVLCEDLVVRARAGEQNAIALIMGVSERAKEGVPRAKLAHSILNQIVRDTSDDAAFGALGFIKSATKGVIRGVGGGAGIAWGVHKTAFHTLKEGAKRAKTPIQYAALASSHIPGIGTGVAAGLAGASALAEGRPIDEALVEGVAAAVPGQPLSGRALKWAYKNSGDVKKIVRRIADEPVEVKRAAQVGFSVGTAKRLQILKNDGPISIISGMAAWELGE